MRQIERVPLSQETLGVLWERRCKVVDAGARPMKPGEREEAQYGEAKRLWKQKQNKAFDEIRSALRDDMAPGHGYCMYCEWSHGDTIDHYRPMEKYPTRAFEWDNYLWSCARCNSGFKKTQFPLDKDGLPLLINPTRDDPRAHLDFLPRSGKLEGRTPKGDETISILGFDRRGELDNTRAFAFRNVQRLIVNYEEACAKDDGTRALEIQHDLCCHPHASLLSVLVEILGKPGGTLLVQEPRCAAILAAYPQIRSWV